MDIIVWTSVDEDAEELHSCIDCGVPCSIEEPICWTCEGKTDEDTQIDNH